MFESILFVVDDDVFVVVHQLHHGYYGLFLFVTNHKIPLSESTYIYLPVMQKILLGGKHKHSASSLLATNMVFQRLHWALLHNFHRHGSADNFSYITFISTKPPAELAKDLCGWANHIAIVMGVFERPSEQEHQRRVSHHIGIHRLPFGVQFKSKKLALLLHGFAVWALGQLLPESSSPMISAIQTEPASNMIRILGRAFGAGTGRATKDHIAPLLWQKGKMFLVLVSENFLYPVNVCYVGGDDHVVCGSTLCRLRYIYAPEPAAQAQLKTSHPSSCGNRSSCCPPPPLRGRGNKLANFGKMCTCTSCKSYVRVCKYVT